jgi:hypothetical protein
MMLEIRRLHGTAVLLGLLAVAVPADAGMTLSLAVGAHGDAMLSDGGEAGLRSSSAELAWTRVLDGGGTIIEHAVSGSLFEFDGLAVEDRVGEAAYRLTWIRNPAPHRTWIVVLQPTIASSFEADLGADDFNLTAAVLRLTHRSANLSLGWGLAYTMQFGTPFPIPLAQIRWTDGGRWFLEALLPSSIVLDRDLGRGWQAGADLTVAGGQYRLDPAAHGVDNPQLQRVETVIGPHLGWTSRRGDTVRLNAGWAVVRELRLMDGRNEVVDLEPDTGPSLGLSARILL